MTGESTKPLNAPPQQSLLCSSAEKSASSQLESRGLSSSPTSSASSSSSSSGNILNGLGDNNSHGNDDSKINNNNSSLLDSVQNKTSIPDSSGLGLSAALLPSIGLLLRLTLGATIALYILNQKHMLPQPISSVVSRVLFWPTLPITISKRLGKWYTPIDDTIIMGGAPFGFAKLPELLYEQYGVRNIYLQRKAFS
jgi:hypothetical protein